MSEYTLKRAYWLNTEHTKFSVQVEIDNKFINYIYIDDGTDDSFSDLSVTIQKAYRSGELNVEECPDSVRFQNDLKLSNKIRNTRNKLMSDTDYLMTVDYPITEDNLSILKEYRQALRDITNQKGFPHHVDWPKKPDFIIK